MLASLRATSTGNDDSSSLRIFGLLLCWSSSDGWTYFDGDRMFLNAEAVDEFRTSTSCQLFWTSAATFFRSSQRWHLVVAFLLFRLLSRMGLPQPGHSDSMFLFLSRWTTGRFAAVMQGLHRRETPRSELLSYLCSRPHGQINFLLALGFFRTCYIKASMAALATLSASALADN